MKMKLLSLTTIVLFSSLSVTPVQPHPTSDAAIYALIEALRQRATQIQIDGKGEDWEGIPAFGDPSGDALEGDASRDIVRVAVAPRENDLLILIATADKPSQDHLAFWFDVDLLRYNADDIRIGIARRGQHSLLIFLEDRWHWVTGTISGLQVAIGDVVEVAIPYAALEKALPTEMARLLTARSWVRVSPFAKPADRFSPDIMDFGASVASYRLIPTPYPLDLPFPVPSQAPLAIPLPMNGKWWIGSGPLAPNAGSHAGWAIDIDMRDHTLSPSRVRKSDGSYSNRNEDYYGWEQPVFAPVPARVLKAVNDQPDGTPPGLGPTTQCNIVHLDLGSNVLLTLCHLRQGSVTVREGEQILAGKVVGLVGSSGLSPMPHLHTAFYQLPEGRVGLPMAFASVRVGLNPQPDDPWTRELAYWEVRGGFFVENVKKW